MKDFLYSAKIKNWFSVTRPSTKIFVAEFLTALFPYLLTIVLAYPTAKIITCLSIFDYSGAMNFLLYEFLIILAINISWVFNNLFYSMQLKHIYLQAQQKIYDKIINIKTSSGASKEKLLNIISNNLYTMAEYSNTFAKQIACFVGAVATLVIVFISSILVGLIVLGATIIIYVILKIVNNYISKNAYHLNTKQDEICEVFSDIYSGRDEINNLSIEPGLEQKYMLKTKEIANIYKKQNFLNTIKNNYLKIFWCGLVALSTLYFIYQVKYNFMSLTLFLVIIPYLSESIEKFITVFDDYYNLEFANIAAYRIKTIYDMPEKDLIAFGSNIYSNISGSVTLTNVSYENSNFTLEPFSCQIKKGDFVIFKGIKDCGKRHIFNMLRREEKPLAGTITIDTINIYDFSIQTYKHHLSYTTKNPYFFDMSIYDNLKLSGSTKREIFATLKRFEIFDSLSKLPSGLSTNFLEASENISSFDLFLLGLARAKLTKSKIILIYELPVGMQPKQLAKLKNILKNLSRTRTIILFTASSELDQLADKIYPVKNGKVDV